MNSYSNFKTQVKCCFFKTAFPYRHPHPLPSRINYSVLYFHGSSLPVHLSKHWPWCTVITSPGSYPPDWESFRAELPQSPARWPAQSGYWIAGYWVKERRLWIHIGCWCSGSCCFFSTQMIRPPVLMETWKAVSMTTARWLIKHFYWLKG